MTSNLHFVSSTQPQTKYKLAVHPFRVKARRVNLDGTSPDLVPLVDRGGGTSKALHHIRHSPSSAARRTHQTPFPNAAPCNHELSARARILQRQSAASTQHTKLVGVLRLHETLAIWRHHTSWKNWCTFWALSLRMICDQLRLHASSLQCGRSLCCLWLPNHIRTPSLLHALTIRHCEVSAHLPPTPRSARTARPTASTYPRSSVAVLFLSGLTKDSATLRASARRMNTCECFPLQAASPILPLPHLPHTWNNRHQRRFAVHSTLRQQAPSATLAVVSRLQTTRSVCRKRCFQGSRGRGCWH